MNLEFELVLISIGILGVVGLAAAGLLYLISQLFKVEEDPRIDLVVAVLPGANCGGCGFAGCRNFAEACVKAGGIDGLACPVGGEPTMEDVKRVLTPAAAEEETPAAAEGGDKKGFDPVIAAKIKALSTPKAAYPNLLGMAQKK
jgi:Na+-translocating ferredoxin:NAD+ oxidoreductase RNF subunit RnfB